MATAGIVIAANFPELVAVRNAIDSLKNPRFSATSLAAALKRAIEPTEARLKELTPLGPTGNLKAAVTSKVITYTGDGNAVALVGYRRAAEEKSKSAAGGTVRASSTKKGDRAFHQWFIEQGTRSRQITVKSTTPYGRRGHLRSVPGKPAIEVMPHQVKAGQNKYIASSYRKLGPFKMVPTDKNPNGGTPVQTTPGYPRAFFKASGRPFEIRESPQGGRAGQSPLRTAFQQTQGQVAFILQQDLQISFQRAIETLVFRGQGTIDGNL